ncbi:MAG: DUF4926 domain-containing protein [bacterium]|nr:DUF4926 domain-containing protein [bacterium]
MKLLAVVALLENISEKNLLRGHVGTIVEDLTPNVFLVEFSGSTGQAYAMASLHAEQLLLLHHAPVDTAR